jgi:hypothetical protein
VKLLISSFNLEIINRFLSPANENGEKSWQHGRHSSGTFSQIYELKGSFSGNAAILHSGNENM